MAIDPSISLGVKGPDIQPVDWKGWMALGIQNQVAQQNISASKSAQAVTNATLPGTVAQSTSLQQKAQSDIQDQKAKDLVIQLAANPGYQTDDGRGGKTVDYPKVYGELAKSYPQQSAKMAGDQFDTMYKGLQVLQQTAAASGEQALTAGKWLEFSNKSVQTTANIINKANIPEDQKPKLLQDTIEKQALAHPDAFKDSPYVAFSPAVPPTQDAQGNVIPGKPAAAHLTQLLNSKDIESLANGSMDPLTTAKLQISQNELALAQRQASPQYKAAISTIQSPETRAASSEKAAAGSAYLADLNAGINAEVESALFGKAGSVGQQKWQELVKQNPAYAQKEAAIIAYNAAHNTDFSIAHNGVDTINTLLKQESAKVGAVVTTNKQIATQGTIPGSAVPSTPGGKPMLSPATPSAPPVKTEGVQRMKGPDGSFYRIPLSKVVDASKHGYTLAPQ